MSETELKCCELCGRIFTRPAHPQQWVDSLGHWLEVPRSPICPVCVVNPPKEEDEEPVVVEHHYRVTMRRWI